MCITLGSCLFGVVKQIKNADPDKYGYSGNGIRFDSSSPFSWSDGSWVKIFIVFGADRSSTVYVDYKNKNILFLGEDPAQWLYDITLTAEAKYPINIIPSGKKLC